MHRDGRRSPRRSHFVYLVAASLLATATWALGPDEAKGRFGDRLLPRRGGVIAVAPQPLARLDAADVLRQRWEEFQNRAGGRWRVYLDERTAMPTLVSGRGLGWFDDEALAGLTLAQVEQRARAFLVEHRDLLGHGGAGLELDEQASADLGGGRWLVVFRQVVDGVRVENARLQFHLRDGVLTLFGASNWGSPRVGGRPTIDVQDARMALDDYLGQDTSAFEPDGQPQLVLMALDAAAGSGKPRRWAGPRGQGLTHALVWRLAFHDPDGGPELWTAEVDAHDGSIRAFYDAAHYTTIRGGVFPKQPDGDCGEGGCEIDGFPMPFADWSANGQPASHADVFGNLTCADPDATVTTSLRGPYVEVNDQCGPISESARCGDGIELGLKTGADCDVDQNSSPGNTAAARSGYYHVNRVAEVARFYNPANAWLQTPVELITNFDRTCNASWGGSIYMYRSGNGCANGAEVQGVVVHEWGHGYDQNDGGGYDNTSEAYGDLVAMLATRESCFFRGFFADGGVCSGYGDTCLTCTGFRDFDYEARVSSTPATPQGFVASYCGTEGTGPCGGEVHCEAYPIGEAMYDLAVRDLPAAGMDLDSAWQLVERLWYSTRQGSSGAIYTCALPDSDSCAVGSWYQRLREADDDDADLSNGTPHAAELFAAFDRHNIACGEAGAPENQSTSSCPALDPPTLTVTANEDGTTLSWPAVAGASQYLVLRGELGCDRQQVPLAVLDSAATSYLDAVSDPGLPRDFRIQAIGVNPTCRSAVSECRTTPAGPRLQLNGHRLVEDGTLSNGNGLLDPGETVRLPVTLFNAGRADAFDVNARLRMVDSTQGRVLEPQASTPDLAVGAAAESDAPHFELTLFESSAHCGDPLALDLEMHATETGPWTRRFEIPLGIRERDFVDTDTVTIPRLTPEPVTSTVDVLEDRPIAELDVSVSIAHPDSSELIVELTSPTGTTVRLHDRTGGSPGLYTRYDLDAQPDGPGTMDDFAGESILGTWTLSVEDKVYGAFGMASIQGFTLHVVAEGAFDCDPVPCAEPAPSESPQGLRLERLVDTVDGLVDLTFDWTGVVGAAGYHVLQSPVAPFDADVELAGRTAGPTTLTLTGVDATRPGLTFFQVRATNGCHQESP